MTGPYDGASKNSKNNDTRRKNEEWNWHDRQNHIGDGHPQGRQSLFDCIWAIVKRGRGKEIARIALDMGALGGLSTEARGTVTNDMQSLLGLEDREYTIVQILSRRAHTPSIMREISSGFAMHKAGHGIAFCSPIVAAIGLNALFRVRDKYGVPVDTPEEAEDIKVERAYELMTVIVKTGYADDAMSAARAAGAEGGTIIHGRGMSVRENAVLFGVAIQPEKDVLMCVIPSEKCGTVMKAVTEAIGLDQPGQGIVYSIPVTNVMGIVHGDRQL